MTTPPAVASPTLISTAEFSAATKGRIKADDARLLPLLEGVSSALRSYCGWHVTPVIDQALVLDTDGGRMVTLPTLHLQEVRSLALRRHSSSIWGEYTSDQLEALEWSHTGELRFPQLLPAMWRSVRVTARHGYATAPDLAAVVVQVVANAISSPLGATREQAGQLSVSWATTAPGVSGGISLLERDYALLDRYRLP